MNIIENLDKKCGLTWPDLWIIIWWLMPVQACTSQLIFHLLEDKSFLCESQLISHTSIVKRKRMASEYFKDQERLVINWWDMMYLVWLSEEKSCCPTFYTYSAKLVPNQANPHHVTIVESREPSWPIMILYCYYHCPYRYHHYHYSRYYSKYNYWQYCHTWQIWNTYNVTLTY